MDIRQIIITHLAAIVEENSPLPFPNPVPDDTRLEDFWLDSIAFTSLFVAIEEEVDFIPADILKGVAFPQTIGELVEMYETELRERVQA